MPSISSSSQSFAIDGRKTWLVVAAMEYAKIAPEAWRDRLIDARDAGFNTIMTGCPWLLHEPRRGHLVFDGGLDIRRFIAMAGELGLKVILRIGPHIGSGFDGGGIPSWITREPNVRVRMVNEAFHGRTSRYLQALLGTVANLQVTREGPIIAIQIEDSWSCGNEEAARPYLDELSRMTREAGISVPLLNANNLWVDRGDTIDTWHGREDLLANLRQLRTLQPDMPRLAAIPAATIATFGANAPPPAEPEALLRAFGQVLAAGAQPIVQPFHGGTFFGLSGGRIDGAPESVTTSAAVGAPLGEAGHRGAAFHRLRRIATFASRFGSLFAELDPAYQPPVLNGRRTSGETKRGAADRSIVPLRGRGGQVIFLFGPSGTPTELLLEDGTHLPIQPGDQSVSWYVMDVDLQRRGRLDFANVPPFAWINQTMLVFYGPAKSTAIISVNDTPIETIIPSGRTPLVIDEKGVRVVICNEAQIDAATALGDALVIGGTALPTDAHWAPVDGWSQTLVIRAEGEIETTRNGSAAARQRAIKPVRPAEWMCSPATEYADGSAARFATLAGPQSLPECGAPQGYGWYRLSLRVGAAKKRRVLAPFAGPRVHWFADGRPIAISGSGIDATSDPFILSLGRGDRHVSMLVDNTGRLGKDDGAQEMVGIYGPLYEVKTLSLKPRRVTATPVDPFLATQFITGMPAAHLSDVEQAQWSFMHAKKSPLIIIEQGLGVPGTLIVNDQPVARLGDRPGHPRIITLDPGTLACFSGNKHTLRFAPDESGTLDLKRIASSVTFHEILGDVGQNGAWSYAKWEAPPVTRFRPPEGDHAPVAGVPAWWRCRFDAEPGTLPLWLHLRGMSRGTVLLNDTILGRYVAGTADGKPLPPQSHLLIPEALLRTDAPNDLLVFDLFGCSPTQVEIVARAEGDLDSP